MTTATAKVILDSVSPDGIRLTTLQLRYPRMIHGEFLTHRALSRNGRSSRAVPFNVLVKEWPYVPHFMKNQPGMVASEEMSIEDLAEAQTIWTEAAIKCQEAAQELADLGVHKQWVNRMLEWFGYIDVLVSGTDWENFMALRDEAGAQPEIRDLAVAIKEAMAASKPTLLQPNEWHLPYIESNDLSTVMEHLAATTSSETYKFSEVTDLLKKISVARCARLTIKPFDGDGSIEKELKRYELLMVSRPVHASPAEHIATPDTYCVDFLTAENCWDHEGEHGNFTGWRQFRKQIPHNTVY